MSEGRARKIIHIDMDAFYASVEQRDNPDLKNRPVAVGYPAKRGVVAAASYEARRFGVRSAMPSTVAMRRCPELVFVAPRFDVYRAVSQQIHAIFKDYTPLVEPLSLDEAYLDVTDNLSGIRTAWETAKEIRARILAETELTASAGVSLNKFLAKLASDQRKPNGQRVVVRVADAADGGLDPGFGETLGVFNRDILGGFKRSSQHLDWSCDEHSKTALGSVWAGALVLTRSTAGGRARGAAAILGSDCGRHGE